MIGTGGFLETPNQRISARSVTPIHGPDDLAQVAIARRNGRELRIGDVAKVVYGPQPLIGDAVVNDGPGLLLVVEKLQGANTLEVTKGVEDALKDLRPGLPGVEIDSTIFRPASFVELAIHNLKVALLVGCLLVILVLVAFLFEWRAAFISLVAIPLSLVAAGVVLTLRGATINTMILAGFAVAVGVVVDDAIIDMENIVRRLRLRGRRPRRPSRSCGRSSARRSRCGARSSTRRSSTSSRWCRSCSSAASPGRSSSRSRCPTPWRCWSRWSSR